MSCGVKQGQISLEAVSDDNAVEPNSAFPDERQAYIARLVATRGKVRVAQLTEHFGVSDPTIRKDLAVLEQKGLLKRTHGGAVSVRPPVEQEVASRQARHWEAKAAIARACVRLLASGEAVFQPKGAPGQAVRRCEAFRQEPLLLLRELGQDRIDARRQ
jgi:predicted transcriptional regulator